MELNYYRVRGWLKLIGTMAASPLEPSGLYILYCFLENVSCHCVNLLYLTKNVISQKGTVNLVDI